MTREEILLRVILGNQAILMSAIGYLVGGEGVRKQLQERAEEMAKMAAEGFPK